MRKTNFVLFLLVFLMLATSVSANTEDEDARNVACVMLSADGYAINSGQQYEAAHVALAARTNGLTYAEAYEIVSDKDGYVALNSNYPIFVNSMVGIGRMFEYDEINYILVPCSLSLAPEGVSAFLPPPPSSMVPSADDIQNLLDMNIK